MSSDAPRSRKLRAPKLLDAEGLWSYALKVLGMRALSSGEVREKLRRKAENEADVDRIITRLRDAGYLNDGQFAEGYARARRETNGLGKLRVVRDLRHRRVAPNIAAKAVAEVFEDADETQMIEAYLARKFRNVDLAVFLKEDRNLAAAYRRLVYAGFQSGACINVLKRYASQAVELEPVEDPGADL